MALLIILALSSGYFLFTNEAQGGIKDLRSRLESKETNLTFIY